MIERYTRPEMGAVWAEQRKLDCWLSVELAVVDALGDVQARVDGGLSSKDFVCSWVLGITTTGEWYRAGFEKVVDRDDVGVAQ